MEGPPLKKLKASGQRQRIERSERTTNPVLKESHLAHSLLAKWAWGESSPQQVQALAAAALKDFAVASAQAPLDLAFLTGLGDSGKYPSKMHQQIMSFANKQCRFSSGFSTSLEFKEPWTHQLQVMRLPHIVFSDLYHKYNGAFRRFILPSEDTLEAFWKLQLDHPALPGSPASSPTFEPRKTVPISCHGDGTPVIGIGKVWSRMLTSYSWSSMVCEAGWTKDSQLPIWYCFDETDAGPTTQSFFEILAWSFQALQSGYWPKSDHKGKQILGCNHCCLVL